MAAVVHFQCGGRLREGKGGGGQAASGGGKGKEEEAEQHSVEGGERKRRPSGV
jgi:hypothetical protein